MPPGRSRARKLAVWSFLALALIGLSAYAWSTTRHRAQSNARRRYCLTSALWTTHPLYLRYVLVLAHSFRRTNAAFIAAARPDMVLMTYANVSFPPETVAAFAAVGWQTRNVPRIDAPEDVQAQFRENYGRLDAWQWAEYDRVVYLDADCMVVGSLEPMFRMPRGLVGTVGDVWEDRLDEDNFNAGVLSFDPDQRIYNDLMAEHLNSTSYVWHGWAEQGLLNWYFKDRDTRLPRVWNMNLMLTVPHAALWRRLLPDARVIHYTIFKASARGEEVDLADLRGRESGPWSAPLAEPVSWWWREYKQMMAELQLTLPPVILAA